MVGFLRCIGPKVADQSELRRSGFMDL